ncbi:paraneoplastic antigen Ma1 homolog [Amblyraja radiata]|uniref:paraneoplastic antigen Ma1 homolog n=1 Tax=Amblyraja radiata TaxID=386614 RepID=UPI001402A6C3|nr:paraneoplastic antigen Ma1 homolog [Amblyraja radiata]
MTDEGKSVNDVQAMLTTETPQGSSPESIIRAVGDLLGKSMRPTSENNVFRRLRMFSGNLPTPPGEESLDHWLEQAYLMIEECDCSEREKQKRIVESLKGPALEIIQAVRLNDPDASPDCYVKALESACGTPVSGEDLYFAFRSLHQQSGEKLSDFLRRLERSLIKVVQKGGLLSHRADHARIHQLIRGATDSDMMLLQLRLRERKEKPPTFLKLLNEIREEEECETARRKLTTTVRQVQVRDQANTKATEDQKLKAEIQELRAELGELREKQQDTHTEPKFKPTKKTIDTEKENEVQMLRQQVLQLQHQLTVMSVSHSPVTADLKKRDGKARPSPAAKPHNAKDSESFFCYRCGENGHIATHCTAPENSPKVIQKLLGALRKSKEDKASHKRFAESKQVGPVYTQQPRNLPQGLVDPSMMADGKIDGQPCRAILDSGSSHYHL